ncbi:MAG: hypothetical protein Q9M30_06770 [Mariprofundaceae bacterium]|nr:hypothetical protein [Mariprofundaceae bacterium]
MAKASEDVMGASKITMMAMRSKFILRLNPTSSLVSLPAHGCDGRAHARKGK